MPSRTSSSKRSDASVNETPDRSLMASTVAVPSTCSSSLRQMGGSSNHSRSSLATASVGTLVDSTGQNTSIVPLTSSGASEGTFGGGGTVTSSLWRANSWGSNGGRTVARSLLLSCTAAIRRIDLGLL